MNNMKVSVIIPYYNSEMTILRAIQSVINQSYKNIELILINDGSQDNSEKIVEDYISNNKFHLPIKHIKQKNLGVSVARNRGVKESQYEYIAFLDSDDSWKNDKLEKQINIFDLYNCDMLGCKLIVNSHIPKKNKYKDIQKISFKQMLFKHYFSTPTVIMKKNVFLNVGGFKENQHYAEDTLLWLKICQKYNVYLLNDYLVNIYKDVYGASGLSANISATQKNELKNFKYFKNDINFFLYYLVIIFSQLKYMKRLLVVKFKRRNN